MQLLRPIYPDALALAPNTDTAIAAQQLAQSDEWTALGMDDYRLWGTHKNCEVAIYRWLPQYGHHCSCDKDRCQHVIGLYLLMIERPDDFTQGDAPSYVNSYLSHPFDSSLDERRKHISTGFEQLDTWLTNLMRHGLGEPHVQKTEFWVQIAERMAAAFMPSIAQTLRDLPALFKHEDDWVEPLLHRLGRLYLLIRSFDRYEAHPIETQADLRSAVDWLMTADEIDRDPVRDDWVVIGRQEHLLNSEVPDLRVWVYGMSTGHIAEVRGLGFRRALPIFSVPIGYRVDADVVFEPTKGSQRAVITTHYSEPAYDPRIVGQSMSDMVSDFSQKLSVNPWLSHYVTILDEVYPTRFDKYWTLRYADGHYLPIAPDFKHKWVLYALSAGAPIQVVTLWDGQYLYPLSAIYDDHMVDMEKILEYK